MDDPWLREMRHDGSRALFALMPRLRVLTGDVEVRDVKIVTSCPRSRTRRAMSTQSRWRPPPGNKLTMANAIFINIKDEKIGFARGTSAHAASCYLLIG